MARVKEYLINISPISWKKIDKFNHSFYGEGLKDRNSFEIHLQNIHGDDPKFTTPIKVEATFFMPIPKAIGRRKKYAWHTGLPEIDALQKFLIESINKSKIIWADDRLVSSLSSVKVYDKNPRTHFVISELE